MGKRIKTPQEITGADASYRETMYNGWARGKKWVEVKVEKLKKGIEAEYKWVASCEIGEQNFAHYEFGDSKAQVIQRMELWLMSKGYEISNLAELFVIESDRRTFIEWLRFVEFKREYFKWHEPVPQHKLKDLSFWEKHIENIKIKMPEGKIEYKP